MNFSLKVCIQETCFNVKGCLSWLPSAWVHLKSEISPHLFVKTKYSALYLVLVVYDSPCWTTLKRNTPLYLTTGRIVEEKQFSNCVQDYYIALHYYKQWTPNICDWQAGGPTRRVLWWGARGAARREAEAGVNGVRWNVRHDFLFI